MKTKSNTDDPIRVFRTQIAWAAWLEKNHRKSKGLSRKHDRRSDIAFANELKLAIRSERRVERNPTGQKRGCHR